MSTADDSGSAEGTSANGHGLGDNLAVQAARADWLYHSRRFQARAYGPCHRSWFQPPHACDWVLALVQTLTTVVTAAIDQAHDT